MCTRCHGHYATDTTQHPHHIGTQQACIIVSVSLCTQLVPQAESSPDLYSMLTLVVLYLYVSLSASDHKISNNLKCYVLTLELELVIYKHYDQLNVLFYSHLTAHWFSLSWLLVLLLTARFSNFHHMLILLTFSINHNIHQHREKAPKTHLQKFQHQHPPCIVFILQLFGSFYFNFIRDRTLPF